ncbi:MAG: DegT/DnrJ/EryC1/StrS family aminotransferase [Bryobacteraceae bacterium]
MVPPTKRIPLLDLTAQHARIREEVLAEVIPLIDSQRFILGEPVEKLEQEIAAYCSVGHAVGCASGSDALELSLMALGIGPGDEVLTVPFTFYASAAAISLVGAKPVFADIEPGTLTMDIEQAARVLERHPRIRAVIPVHLFGGCADCDALTELTKPRGIAVVEDAAQAIGAESRGRRAGSLGDFGCFSFFPSKNLGGWGDGGMVTTPDAERAAKLRSLRVHGSRRRYYHESIGVNSRLDAVQAVVLRVKLRHLEDWTAARSRNAAAYRELLRGMPVQLPVEGAATSRHVYNQFTIQAPRRDELRAYLDAAGIGTETYYPLPLHLQECYSGLGYREGDFPVSEQAAKQALSLPIHAELSQGDLEKVAESIGKFYERPATGTM